ncbi:hypothetical protein ASE61_14975 [Bosea sp. Root670]|uniref:hypothetical protein n=1 Tax=Bosea sp. Root670 TaxID=1736583 RepID=UPI000713BEF8|nr:hypothetical protein [Bosea sp. Root670]KRE02580.1 hypothetical protein ASE61_14975 [Bosea sp. Root670]
MIARLGDWIQTFSGRQFWPLDPRPEEIAIEDIAHALAHDCRFGGHCRRFYSVAEHSVLLARAVAPDLRLAALMHDSPEGYLRDLVRPVKRTMPSYRAAETAIWLAICARFGLPIDLPAEVHEADNRILVDERQQNMAPPPAPWNSEENVEPLGVRLQFWTPVEAEFQFMILFDSLIAGSAPSAGLPPRGATRFAGSHG